MPTEMSVEGQKPTLQSDRCMSAVSSEADIAEAREHVRFGPLLTKVHCSRMARYSITSSASDSKLSEILRPSALAVFILITVSNLTGSDTGISAGFAPLRTLPT